MRLLLLSILLISVAKTHAQETKTSIGFSLNPNYSSIRYIKSETGAYSDGYLNELKVGTHGAVGLSGEVFFQYKLTDKFLINWGIGLQNYRSRISYYSQSQLEHPTIQRDTKYTQYYLQINVSAKYRFYESFYARVGVGGDFLLEQHARRTETCPTCDYSYQGRDHSSVFSEAMLPVSVGLGYEMKLNDRLQFMTELYGTISLTNAFSDTVFSDQVQFFSDVLLTEHMQQRPFQFGLKMGVIRSF